MKLEILAFDSQIDF